MDFTSIRAYIDPANWQQQQQNHHTGSSAAGGSGGGTSSQQQQQQQQQLVSLPLPPPPTQPHGAGGTGSIRPGSMTDRARMANIQMPEAAQKCPRCDSTNTKFCYYNNYSLSQPRHFCKTCKRYWTQGGNLRNVPVGGGCRRNKRSKGSSSSKSAVSSDRQMASASSTNSVSSNSGSAGDILGLPPPPHAPPPRFMAPLLTTDFAAGGEMGLNYGLNYNTISASIGGGGDFNFQIGSALGGGVSAGGGGGGSILFAAGLEQWRVPQTQQFPFLAGIDASPGLYPFEGGATEGPGYGGAGSSLRPKVSTSGVMTQLASVKMEENPELNLSRQFLGINNPASDDQYWCTAATTTPAWTDLSGFSSSSNTSNQL